MTTPTASAAEFRIHLPEEGVEGLEQDEEFFEIEQDGRRRKIRFHDYDEIFSVPGLYERLFAARLQCKSPQVVVGLLEEALQEEQQTRGSCAPSTSAPATAWSARSWPGSEPLRSSASTCLRRRAMRPSAIAPASTTPTTRSTSPTRRPSPGAISPSATSTA